MKKYIVKRILLSVVILFFVSFIIYCLMRCLPTSYIESIARSKSMQPGSKSFDEWMELDLKYVRERSFLTDWKIIFKTVWTVLRREGISSETSATMEEFMGTEAAEAKGNAEV